MTRVTPQGVVLGRPLGGVQPPDVLLAQRGERDHGAAAVAYLLPDGSLPELCDHDDGIVDHGPVGGLVVAICDACLFTSAPGLGAVAEVVPLPIVERPIGRVEIADERAEGEPPRDARARGPPPAG